MSEFVMPEFETSECFKARLLRSSLDIPAESIPDDLQAIKLDGYNCSFVRNDGAECTFSDPMIFLKQNVGFVAMGSRHFCRLAADSPHEFKKAALGSLSARALRFGREALSLMRQKWAN
jgi:hypothetical protein